MDLKLMIAFLKVNLNYEIIIYKFIQKLTINLDTDFPIYIVGLDYTFYTIDMSDFSLRYKNFLLGFL